MASEYWKWKFRDVKPDEKIELTPEEKRRNWWDYHKWHIAVGVVLVGIAGNLVWHALSQVHPDYQIAYVGENSLPDDTAAAIESAFAALGEDLNGDGKVVVQLNQYPTSTETDAELAEAAAVTLMADILDRQSYFFLLEDPDRFQVNYRSLCLLDGSLPEEGNDSADGTYLAWGGCPALAEAELGDYSYQVAGETVTGSSDGLADKLFLARRGFWPGDTCAHQEGCDALWERLTEGALS